MLCALEVFPPVVSAWGAPHAGTALAAGGWPGWEYLHHGNWPTKRRLIYCSVYGHTSQGQDPGGSSQENLALGLLPAASDPAVGAVSVSVSGCLSPANKPFRGQESGFFKKH